MARVMRIRQSMCLVAGLGDGRLCLAGSVRHVVGVDTRWQMLATLVLWQRADARMRRNAPSVEIPTRSARTPLACSMTTQLPRAMTIGPMPPAAEERRCSWRSPTVGGCLVCGVGVPGRGEDQVARRSGRGGRCGAGHARPGGAQRRTARTGRTRLPLLEPLDTSAARPRACSVSSRPATPRSPESNSHLAVPEAMSEAR